MKTNELKAERIRQNKNTEYMAALINKSNASYRQKESGSIRFTSDEIAAISNDLGLSPESVNDIFFDGKITDW